MNRLIKGLRRDEVPALIAATVLTLVLWALVLVAACALGAHLAFATAPDAAGSHSCAIPPQCSDRAPAVALSFCDPVTGYSLLNLPGTESGSRVFPPSLVAPVRVLNSRAGGQICAGLDISSPSATS